MAGVGQGLSVSQTGVPVALITSATAAATVSDAKAVVVADQHAFARVFAADDVARDRLRHDARVRKREVFRDHAAPSVGSKLNRSHKGQEEVYAKRYIRQTAGLD